MAIRILDVFFSLLLLLFLSPILIIIAFLLFLERKGGVLFIQVRVGKDEQKFNLYKFRTMVKDNNFKGTINDLNFLNLSYEEKLHLRKKYKTTTLNDDRVTNLGRILRKTNFDEIPQLFNVFLGEMSLVGPRPDVQIQEVDYKKEDWKKRTSIKPGLTGLSQINGRSELSLEDRVKFDNQLVDNLNLKNYLGILFKTLFVFFGNSN